MKSSKALTILGLTLLLCIPACAKEHAWRDGKLLDEYVEWRGSTITEHRYAIEEGRYVYITSFEKYDTLNKYAPFYVFGLSSSKKPKITVNAPIKFALEGDKAYILDDAGREHKLRVEKRVLKN